MAFVQRYLQTAIVLIMLAFFGFVLWGSQDFREAGRIFPIVISSAGLVIGALELLRQIRQSFASEAADFTDLADSDDMDMGHHYRMSGLIFLMLVGFVVLIFLIGILPATTVFVLGLLRGLFKAPWTASLAVTAGVVAMILVLTQVLVLRWPQPLIALPGLS